MKNDLEIYFVLGFLFIFPSIACADVYKWTDDRGVHYSDEPRSGASQVTLPSPQSYHSSDQKEFSDRDHLKALSPISKVLPVNHSYSEVSMSQPANESTIWDSEEKICVTVSLMPSLMEGDTLLALLDGKPSGDPQTSTHLVLAGVGRGEHTVQVQVLNAQGKEIGKTQRVVVYVHHTSTVPAS